MLKTLRMVKEKTLDKPTGQDAEDKKRIKDLEEAVQSLLKSIDSACRAMSAANVNMAALHLDIANVYPAGEDLSSAVMTLNSSGQVFKEAPKMAEDVTASFAAPLQQVLARLRDLYAKADQRQVIRAEITHYREKVTRLANDGLTNAKAQAKAESNQEKLLRNQQQFKELDAELSSALENLDRDTATAMNGAVARFIQLQANHATGLLHCYGNALAAIPGAMKTGGPIAAHVMGSPAEESSVSTSVATAAEVTSPAATHAQSMSAFLGSKAGDGKAPEAAEAVAHSGAGATTEEVPAEERVVAESPASSTSKPAKNPFEDSPE